ncbi:hypothetical protein EVAR_32054_1 [Eumeta japonica]|uniref:Uncharacterized protein n=1 Tax=Eumeta variegata TaxID=151549 RepID=A0A4C1WM62_EUMVA|nr:hypothetical protein EVAR_32054_1 [Eumeta japonica]
MCNPPKPASEASLLPHAVDVALRGRVMEAVILTAAEVPRGGRRPDVHPYDGLHGYFCARDGHRRGWQEDWLQCSKVALFRYQCSATRVALCDNTMHVLNNRKFVMNYVDTCCTGANLDPIQDTKVSTFAQCFSQATCIVEWKTAGKERLSSDHERDITVWCGFLQQADNLVKVANNH